MKKGFIILFVLPLFFACSDIENCGTDLNLDYMIVRFYDLETKEAKNVGFEIISSDPLVEFIIPSQTKIENGDTTIVQETSILGLPLNAEANTITYFFNSDTSNHQLVLSYDKEFSILDPDCEPSITFTNLDTVRQSFDSTVIVSRITQLLDDPNTKEQISNFEIYF